MKCRAALLAVCAALLLDVPVRPAEPTADELARAVQRKYQAVRDFSADFTQQQTSVLRKRQTERGKVAIKKPGMMKWDYTSPEEKHFVADGINSYLYIPQDRQVFIAPIPTGDQASTPILFLAGKGDLARDFTPSLTTAPPGTPPGARTLKLTPRTPQPEYDWLTLSVDAATLSLVGLSAMDPQGAVTVFTFTNLKENVNLPVQLFAFKPPKGVEVVTDLTH
ncbi:MAG TPA: outer membrane lipoprotein carrier protein LolA [Vicinamibacterales bacterium]|nr:outer membrane lipoprotein carrier protein LolA [Vicinamibacterales bacterium]